MRGLLLGAAAVLLAACSSTVVTGTGTGTGSATSSTPSGPSASPTAAPPAGPGLPAPGTASPSGSGAPAVPMRTVHVPLPQGGALTMDLWAHDRITDCAAHSYGQVAAFFRQHQCRGADRLLWTFPRQARTVALAVEDVGLPPAPAPDIYRWAERFIALENADNTGSIDDLLREGYVIPGADHIPADEAFRVVGQDNGVAVFDAWYLDGPTTPQDPQLLALEQELYLTPATNQP
ncbi:MAG: hypothetical protein ACTHMS_17035 [Jatrophihabitans sp.]|uniref:hypothetical protein n=1 Tax=Jatrophihabitans sp. TaxID=1932789 RepID=UPI003F7D7E13